MYALVILADAFGMHGNDVGAGWMIVMMLGMVLFWALVILGIVWLIREYGPPARRTGVADEARTILDRRFANGEITAKEYEQRRRVLAGGD